MPFPACRAERSGHTKRKTETSVPASPSDLASVSVERVSPACPLQARFPAPVAAIPVVRSGILIQAVLSSSYSCSSTFSPFAPRSLPASPLLWAVRLPRFKKTRGPPRFLGLSVFTRRPLTPRRARWLFTRFPAIGGRLQPFWQAGHSHFM